MTERSSDQIEKEVQAQLAPLGLKTFGWFDADNLAGLLIGNVGGSHWEVFQSSPEAGDGKPDPMNRWTERVIAPISTVFSCQARYPFGEDIWPFQRYAQAATGMKQSPIGLLIHPEYGLWTAFRAALMFEGLNLPKRSVSKPHPCDDCSAKPCLSTCPINAFTKAGFAYQDCRSYLRTSAGKKCLNSGCLARKSCSVGREYLYEDDHQAFHMKAFS